MTEIIALTICLVPYVENAVKAIAAHPHGSVVHPRTDDDAEPVALERGRWQLSDDTTLVSNHAELGSAVVGGDKSVFTRPEWDISAGGDDVMMSKEGKKTFGVGWFYSILAQRPIPALSFFRAVHNRREAVAVVSGGNRAAHPGGKSSQSARNG